MKRSLVFILLIVILLGVEPRLCLAGLPSTQNSSLSQIRTERLKTLYRREPRAQEIVSKIEQKLAQKANTDADLVLCQRTEQALDQIILSINGLSEDRIHDAVNLLESMSGPIKQLTNEDLAPLKERYRKLCALMDDRIFIQDLDQILSIHDRFIRHTALGLYDKNEITNELKRMEDLINRTPEIPYGRLELLRSLQDRRITPPTKGCYLGVFPEEELYLSADRLSVGILEEGMASPVRLDTADVFIQGLDGNLIDLDAANQSIASVPFSPPLTLWMKTRLLEGHIPAINFRLADTSTENYSGPSVKSDTQSPACRTPLRVTDILEGKLDDYFKTNLKLIASTKATTMVGLFSNFDQFAAATAFGADGRTPYYLLVNPKLTKLPREKREAEISKLLEKGQLAKDIGEELRKYYGDPEVPDGPERVRDAWKHIHKLLIASGADCVSLFSTAGAFHGSRKSVTYPGLSEIGAQEWNKLEYYFPGNGILNWLGTSSFVVDLKGNQDSVNPLAAISEFITEARNSSWRKTPLMLRDLAPRTKKEPSLEADWIRACFLNFLPETYPDIKAFFVDYPTKLTLWLPDSFGAFRKYISSNPYYKEKLGLTPATDDRVTP